jgi:hypothetical protein
MRRSARRPVRRRLSSTPSVEFGARKESALMIRVLRVVTIIDLLPVKIIDGRRRLHTVGVLVASSLCSGLSYRSLFFLGGGTENAPLISLRPSLITEHQFASTLNDLAPDLAPRSAGPGLDIANGQTPTLGCECWFRCALSAQDHALLLILQDSRYRPETHRASERQQSGRFP